MKGNSIKPCSLLVSACGIVLAIGCDKCVYLGLNIVLTSAYTSSGTTKSRLARSSLKTDLFFVSVVICLLSTVVTIDLSNSIKNR